MRKVAGSARVFLVTALVSMLALEPSLLAATQIEVRVPADTRIYVVTQEEVIGKKKFTHEGKQVRAQVWRDVLLDGHRVVEAGTGVLVRVDRLKTRKVAGIRGQVSLGAYETTAVSGEPIQLAGGYNKKGKGRIALSAALAGLLFLPLIFIRGKAATLPEGTVFDAYTGLDLRIQVEAAGTPVSVDVGAVRPALRVEVLYEELEKQEKPKSLDLVIYAPPEVSGELVIDRVNEADIEPIALEILSREVSGGETALRARVDLKTLAKEFTRGINRFEVAGQSAGERLATEVVLDIQF